MLDALPVGSPSSIPRRPFLPSRLFRRLNFHLLPPMKTQFLASCRQNATCAGAAADYRADRCTFATACYSPDYCADSGARAHFRHIVFGRTPTLNTTFGVD